MILEKPQITALFDMATGEKAVRDAYVASSEGRVQAPDVTYLGFPGVDGDCHLKTAHIDGDEAFVVKVATGFYGNPAKGRPSSNGVNLLFSAETGALTAILQDEGWLTDMRTGLGGAIATRALANDGFDTVLIVGTGIQARLQAQCLQALTPDRSLHVTIWGRNAEAARAAAADLKGLGLIAEPAADLEQGCRATDVIVTTTPAKQPLIARAWIRPGTHITAIGADSPGKQELATDLVAAADLKVCDLASQSLDHGEFQTAHAAGAVGEEDVVALGDVLAGAHPGRETPSAITIADLTGLAARDAAISLATLNAARSTAPLAD